MAWVVPTYANARSVWRWVERLVRPLLQYGVKINNSEFTVKFPNGGFLGVYSAENADALRGDAFHLVVMDEGARIKETVFTDVVLPALADHQGDLLIPSTPVGKNWFYNAYVNADGKEVAAFHAPTYANPLPNIQAAFEKAKQRTERGEYPEASFREEWLAEFIDDGGQVFRKLKEAQEKYRATEPIDEPKVCGVDWAQVHDFTVFVIMGQWSKRVYAIERFNQVSWQIQRDRLHALYTKWQPTNILAELNSIGSPNVEALQAEGLPVIGFTTTNESKNQIIQALALGLEREEIPLPDDKVLISELSSYAAERLPSGKWRYGAPEGMHDDTVISCALAYWQALNADARQMYTNEAPDIFRTFRG